MPRLKGVPYLEPGTRIYVEDLEAWEKKTGVKAGPGDALILRWGRWTRRAKLGAWDISKEAGRLRPVGDSLDQEARHRGPRLGDAELRAEAGGDTISGDPFHNFVLTMLGVHLLDRCDLDAVAEAAAARNRWEFMLTVAPAPIRERHRLADQSASRCSDGTGCADANGGPRYVCSFVLLLFVVPARPGADDCSPLGGVEFVCGQAGPEDLAPVPGGEWVIAGGDTGEDGAMRLIRVKRPDDDHPVPGGRCARSA